MRKFTLFIASLLLALGAKAQTFVMPETGKYYKIKGDNSQYPWLMGVQKSGGSGAAVSANEADAAIFEKTANGLKVYGTDTYLYYSGSGDVTIGNTESNVVIGDYNKSTDAGTKYSIKVAGAYMYNNNTDQQVHTSGTFITNIERYWGFVEVNMGEQPAQPELISRTGWGVTASSQETSGDPGQATNAIDGNNSTFWHTVYAETYPHWIEFDMTKAYTVYSFDYVSRFDNTTTNGNILNYKLYISNSAMNGNYENATLAASGTFVYGQGVSHLIQLETPVAGRYVALVAESGTCGNWGGNVAKTAANCAEFNVYGIEKPAETNEEATRELGQLLDWVISFDQIKELVGDKVGQYSSSDPDFGYKYYEIAEFHKSITEETTIEAIEEKIAELEALIETFSPNMPVNGKAYTFKNVQKDGTTVCWFTYKNGKIELTKTEAEATAFICRKLENGKYAFAINDGKYMAWRGSSAGGNSASGIFNAYDETWTWFNIEKMTTGNNIAVDLSETRYMVLKGRRLNSPGDNNEFNYTVVKKNGGNPIFDQATAPFYNDNFSSAFIMDEVEYANKPTLNSVGTSELMTSDLHNKAMATFSAPFATVVPEGVKAYYATDGGNYVSLTEITDAIPANTGVILVSDNAGKAIMAPAATETVATVEGNILGNSAGAAIENPNGYILTAKNGVAGFYKASAGTLAMNKSYIAVAAKQDAVEIRLPGTTGIDEMTEQRAESKEIYDLTGRKVNEITAPGIYIVNGKKVLVK